MTEAARTGTINSNNEIETAAAEMAITTAATMAQPPPP